MTLDLFFCKFPSLALVFPLLICKSFLHIKIFNSLLCKLKIKFSGLFAMWFYKKKNVHVCVYYRSVRKRQEGAVKKCSKD